MRKATLTFSSGKGMPTLRSLPDGFCGVMSRLFPGSVWTQQGLQLEVPDPDEDHATLEEFLRDYIHRRIANWTMQNSTRFPEVHAIIASCGDHYRPMYTEAGFVAERERLRQLQSIAPPTATPWAIDATAFGEEVGYRP